MTMPGFTAEAVLRPAGRAAAYAGVFAEQPGGQFVTPQEIKCSDDGRFCLDCQYDSQGRLIYCDVLWLPPVHANATMMSRF